MRTHIFRRPNQLLLSATLLAVAAFLAVPASALNITDDDDVRVSAAVTPFVDTQPLDDDLFALLNAATPAAESELDLGVEDGHQHRVLARSTAVPVVDIALDGDSEMVIIQPVDPAGDGVAHSQLALRSRNDEGWSDWAVLHAHENEAPDGTPGGEGSGPESAAGVGSIGPIWVGEGTTGVEIVLLDSDEAIAAIDSEALDMPEIDVPLKPTLANGSAGWANQPTIRSNADWGSPGFQQGTSGCEDGPRHSDSIRAMVVHHTVTTNNYSQDEVPKLLRGIHRFHTVSRGWCDVAYNFLVDRFGTLWEGRSGGIDKPIIGGHARGFNSNTFAVALLGQHQSNIKSPAPVRPSSASLQAIKNLGAWKLRLHGVDPNGRALLKNTATTGVLKHPAAQYVSVPTILGHRDLGETSCPGNWTMPIISEMKAEFTPRALASPVPYGSTGIDGNDFGPKLMAVDNRGGLRPALGQATPANAPGASTAIAVGGTATAGYVLAVDGTLRAYGDAPAVAGRPGGSSPVDLIVRDSGKSGYVVTADGFLHGFGGQVQDRSSRGPAVAGDVNDDKIGYTVSATGTLNPIHQTPAATLRSTPRGRVIDIVVWASGHSGYVLTDIGEVIGFGAATSYGDVVPTAPVSVVAGPNANGGWVLDSEGRWWTFGDERPVVNASTHVGAGIATDAVLTGYDLTGSSFKKSGDYEYISAVLNRLSPETTSAKWIDHWNWKTDHGGTKVLADAMVRRPEFTSSIVDDMYRRALDRNPDAEGKAYWTGLLNSKRVTLRDMGVYFYGSEELFKRSGSPERYVDVLYDSLLHRAPDAEGRAYWAGLIRTGAATPAQVTAGFYDSIESRRDRVDSLYRRVAGTTPDASQREAWASELARSDDLTLAATMIASPAYYRLVTR